MALYREGKAAMAADGTVTGTGTKWQSSLSLIRPGATIMFLSSPIQMAVVNKVVSDTEIKAITTNGAVVASTDYAILLSDSLTVDGLAQDVAETLRYYQSQETEVADAVDFFKNFDFEALQSLADQVRTDSEAADASASAASASETKAKTSENNAKASENAAKTSEVAAETARDQVQQIINDAGEQSTLVVLAQDDGSKHVSTLGNQPLAAVSHFKNKGMTDQEAVQSAFNSSNNVFIDTDITLTDYITFDRSKECYVYRKPGVVVTGHGYLPKLRTNPAHVVETAIRHNKTSDPNALSYDRVYSHQAFAAEMSVNDVASTASASENFVALYSGIETFNCGKQRIWAFNSVTNAHNLLTGDEVFGYELDMNVDGTLDGGGQYVGLYIAGIGDLSACANADGIRVQRLRDGVYKWQYGLRIFDSVTGINITDASTYSIFASGSAPIVRRKTTQNGGWAYTHSLSASSIKWGVDDYGDTYSRRLYLGAGDGKSKNRVNLDGGVSYYTTNAAVAWGSIAANSYVDKDITTLVGVSIADWTNYTIDVTPIGYAGAMPVVAVQAYINSTKTQAYVRVVNISGAPLSSCNVGLNIKVSGHSATN